MTTTGPHGHAITGSWRVQGNLTVLLEESGNIVLRRDRPPGGWPAAADGIDTTITNVAALAVALYAAAAVREPRP